MILTLESVQAEHQRLGALIAQLTASAPTTLSISAADIVLRQGERYAGLLLDDAGKPLHHLLLLPGAAEDLTWQAALDWAKGQGGELPTRREQSLLFANLKGEFEDRYYWSSEQYSAHDAWFQNFGLGDQGAYVKDDEYRARAVRRFPVSA